MKTILLCCLTCLTLHAAEFRIEAENSSDAKVIQDAACSAGAASTSDRAWQPLLIADTPKADGALSAWIHHRGGPIALKAKQADGKQNDVKWIWTKPEDWTWTRLGRFDQATLGTQLYIIRGDAGSPQLDCVVLRSDASDTPPSIE
ncbi:MAG: hypothetical protein PF961_07890 [Planctomycetota bacterium]|nr:hypothetical protein [Planctomycetota bacterium]